MAYKYEHFIPQNTAPNGVKRIGVYDSAGKRVCGISLGGLTPPTGEKLYSFGLVSDCHVAQSLTSANSSNKLKNALSYFTSQGCIMVMGCGDFTNVGFYRKNEGTTDITIGNNVIPNRAEVVVAPKETYYDECQVTAYSNIIQNSEIPVFEIFGNHENYNGKSVFDETTIDGVVYNSLARAKALTGVPYTAYTVSSDADTDDVVGTTTRPNRQMSSIGDDLFIMVGQSVSAKPMSADDLTWLENILAANENRRCFIFIHSFIDDDWSDTTGRTAEDNDGYVISDSGNPCGARGNAIVGWWEDYDRESLNRFLNALKKAPNAVLFHGHSHMKFESQEHDECANYTDKNGFKSVHVPSLGSPRTLIPNSEGVYDGSWTTNKGSDNYTESDSQCYVVDVYDDCIVLKGMDMTAGEQLVIATYKIMT